METAWSQQYIFLFHIPLIALNQIVFRKVSMKTAYKEYPHNQLNKSKINISKRGGGGKHGKLNYIFKKKLLPSDVAKNNCFETLFFFALLNYIIENESRNLFFMNNFLPSYYAVIEQNNTFLKLSRSQKQRFLRRPYLFFVTF